MSREVIIESDIQKAKLRGAASGRVAGVFEEAKKDNYSDRLIKYIPSEVVSVYIAVSAVLKVAGDEVPKKTLEWIIFAFLLVMTPIYLRVAMNVKIYRNLIISTISFGVWAFTLGGPFAPLSWYNPIYGAILLPLYTFVIAIDPSKKPEDNL